MADQKLDQLTALPSRVATTDLLYVVRSATDYKAAATDLVAGPASATDGVPVLFDGTSGIVLKNSTPTGTGNPVMQTSPTLTTPTIGVATATSVNKVAITAPATSATLTIADGATLTASATATVSGTNTGDQTTAVLAAAVIGDTKLVVGSGGVRGVAESALTAAFAKVAAGVPAAVTVDGTAAEVVLGRSTASSGDPELLATTGTRGSAVVLATSPTLVTPILGTITSGDLSAGTGTAKSLTAGNVPFATYQSFGIF